MYTTKWRLFALGVVSAFAMTGSAFGQGRPSTTDMTCAQAKASVDQAGAIVLGTGGGKYDRFVRSEGICTAQEMGVPTWVPTRDVAQCFIGYVCEDRAGRDPTPN